MKKRTFSLIGGLLFCGALCCLGSLENYVKTSYTREATIINNEDNNCIAEDSTGNTWTFYKEGYEVGDKVKLYMTTNNTDSNIFDDEITKVKMIKED